MTRAKTPDTGRQHIEPKLPGSDPAARSRRLHVLEGLVRALEEELSDDELSDEQKLQNIGERVAQVMDGG